MQYPSLSNIYSYPLHKLSCSDGIFKINILLLSQKARHVTTTEEANISWQKAMELKSPEAFCNTKKYFMLFNA